MGTAGDKGYIADGDGFTGLATGSGFAFLQPVTTIIRKHSEQISFIILLLTRIEIILMQKKC